MFAILHQFIVTLSECFLNIVTIDTPSLHNISGDDTLTKVK